MNCVDCGNKCVNRCCACNKGFCAPCRDMSGVKICLACQAAKEQARQQRLLNLQHSRQQQAVRRQVSQQVQQVVPGPGSTAWMPVPQPLPPHMLPTAGVPTVQSVPVSLRPRLAQMSDGEFADWETRTRAAIRDAQIRTQQYLARRAGHGTRTPVDTALEQELVLLDDLVHALDEIGELRSQVGQSYGTWGGDEMLVSYDEKLKVM